jgi:hypothetical protein
MEAGAQYESDRLDYSGFISGAGMGVDLLVKGNKIYCLGYNLDENDEDRGYTFYTNDGKYAREMPPFMPQDWKEREGAALKFAYKNIK